MILSDMNLTICYFFFKDNFRSRITGFKSKNILGGLVIYKFIPGKVAHEDTPFILCLSTLDDIFFKNAILIGRKGIYFNMYVINFQ